MSDEFERRVLDELAHVRRDVLALTEKVADMKGTVAAISSLIGAVVAGLVVAVAMGFLGGCAQGVGPAAASRGDYDSLESTVVGLVREDGTPFCAGTSTARGVMTAAHCVDDAPGWVRVGVRSGLDRSGTFWNVSHRLRVLAVDSTSDTALLEPLPESLSNRATVRADAARLGEPITVVGHGYRIPYLAHAGRVSRVAAAPLPEWGIPFRAWFGIDAQVAPGFSGGGVFDADGLLVGVLSFSVGPNISGAIPVSLVP